MVSRAAELQQRTFTNPVITGPTGEDHGDPFIIKYLDEYFLYHTGDTSGRRGVSVHRSRDLVHWEFEGYALEAAESGWAWSDIWAPEVVYERGVFYMYVSATHRRSGGPGGRWDEGEGDDSGRRLGLARSTNPLGPFVWDEQPIVDQWSIDGHPFRDDDGSMWLFYNVRSDETRVNGHRGTGTVVDRLLAPDRVEGKPTPVTYPSQPWEGPYGDWWWNEGPYVLKRRGTYYQMYSGGFHRDATYAVGFAEARSPRGPWVKYAENPIFRSGERIVGPGHHSFVFAPDVATRYAVYHAYVAGEEGRKVNLDRTFWVGDRPHIAGPTERAQPFPARPVFDDRVPHWRAEVWARGRWVQVGASRFPLSPTDVWHQVEAIKADGRISVRVGGVLRSSEPARRDERSARPFLASDGDMTCRTISSFLEDGEVHGLPAASAYSWRWGGAGPLELSLAVKGTAELALDGTAHAVGGDPDRFELVQLEHRGGVEEITVRAGADGATVADLFVYARG